MSRILIKNNGNRNLLALKREKKGLAVKLDNEIFTIVLGLPKANMPLFKVAGEKKSLQYHYPILMYYTLNSRDEPTISAYDTNYCLYISDGQVNITTTFTTAKQYDPYTGMYLSHSRLEFYLSPNGFEWETIPFITDTLKSNYLTTPNLNLNNQFIVLTGSYNIVGLKAGENGNYLVLVEAVFKKEGSDPYNQSEYRSVEYVVSPTGQIITNNGCKYFGYTASNYVGTNYSNYLDDCAKWNVQSDDYYFNGHDSRGYSVKKYVVGDYIINYEFTNLGTYISDGTHRWKENAYDSEIGYDPLSNTYWTIKATPTSEYYNRGYRPYLYTGNDPSCPTLVQSLGQFLNGRIKVIRGFNPTNKKL